MAGQLTIELKGLRFFAEHGMYAEEIKIGNEFEVDLCISYKLPKKSIDSIEQTINYVDVYRIVKAEMAEPKHLLETCAIKIVDRLHNYFKQIEKIQINVKKLAPPITNFTGSVGVSIYKEFK